MPLRLPQAITPPIAPLPASNGHAAPQRRLPPAASLVKSPVVVVDPDPMSGTGGQLMSTDVLAIPEVGEHLAQLSSIEERIAAVVELSQGVQPPQLDVVEAAQRTLNPHAQGYVVPSVGDNGMPLNPGVRALFGPSGHAKREVEQDCPLDLREKALAVVRQSQGFVQPAPPKASSNQVTSGYLQQVPAAPLQEALQTPAPSAAELLQQLLQAAQGISGSAPVVPPVEPAKLQAAFEQGYQEGHAAGRAEVYADFGIPATPAKPEQVVIFNLGSAGIMSTFYHVVEVTPERLKLGYDTRWQGTQYLPPAREDATLQVSLPDRQESYEVYAWNDLESQGPVDWLRLVRVPAPVEQPTEVIANSQTLPLLSPEGAATASGISRLLGEAVPQREER